MYFSVNVSFASLPVFLPTILNGMGFSSINAQGLSAPPYFFAFITSLSLVKAFFSTLRNDNRHENFGNYD